MASPHASWAAAGFRGDLLRPGDPGYDASRRVFNAMIDRRPALIARCVDPDDVATTIAQARREGLPLSVYGGGHAVTGTAVVDGGVVCDLRGMRGMTVDPVRRTVRAEGGLTWGELDAATTAHELAVTGGRMPRTGIGGLALGSGSGWLERAFGYTCDNLIAAEVVTASGRRVTASASEHPELFWGLRGGGGNFGVVTAFHFRLHPIPLVMLAGRLLYPPERAVEAVRAFREFLATAPDEVGGAVVFRRAPDAKAVPAELRGRPAVSLVVLYVGDPDDGARALEPLRRGVPASLDTVTPMPYLDVQRLTQAGHPDGLLNYWTGDFLTGLPDTAVDVLCDQGTHQASPLSQVLLVPGGGALSRVPEDATAFGQRRSPWNTHVLSAWSDPADTPRNIAATRAISTAMDPWKTGRSYLNYIAEEGTNRVKAAFGPEKYARLQALKRVWDPDNVFRHNQNIEPGG